MMIVMLLQGRGGVGSGSHFVSNPSQGLCEIGRVLVWLANDLDASGAVEGLGLGRQRIEIPNDGIGQTVLGLRANGDGDTRGWGGRSV